MIDQFGFIVMITLIFFHGLIHMLDTCSFAGLHIDLDFSLLPYFDYLSLVIFFSYTLLYLGYLCVSVCKLQVLGYLTGFGCII